MQNNLKTGYVYSGELLKYRFNDNHPFNQMRLKLTTELLQMMKLLKDDQIINPRIATEEELALIHKYDYIQAIKHASHGILSPSEANKYGLNTDDTFQFQHMHRHSARIVGGALNLADEIMNENILNGCHLGGGLHHSLPGRANGFCIYNDVAITAKYLATKYKQRVMVIDTDAHHGDGTQWSLYTDNTIMCYSIHETGKFLFPGSGHYTERGEDLGYGYTVNLPLEPYTEHDNYLKVFKESVTSVIEAYKPDILLSVHGVDIHYLDPLTHMSCSLETLYEIPYIINKLAHKYTDGKILMFGGGGYNIWKVVPRAWSHIFLALINKPIQEGPLPEQWIKKWRAYSPVNLPKHWTEDYRDYQTIPRTYEISQKNNERASRIVHWYTH
ncbi:MULTISPECIES: acetoin utilization protein AcuC [Staphylococcus]|uniref:acetoin utilization protein AcuC n=1 Tax=Staphylococcus TaxID=1279 RepID=UPI0008A194C8|nr:MULTISPECIES: acetoin utilization protein AcuC [Staphylococcus]MCH4391907.1 acetoin utilization protein AcuC [Staphylococcus haemolyticus]MCI2950054.1 acetoin utilization protein AcuC [Staphylococcus haemolyticus]OFP30043.1 acetoin utilization protein AcuC [Staphylococcus sp. HMSC068H08]OFS55106.1 acetoin utilization protein AcuC [Staphylococcus sp. HMSC065C09]OHP66062.1 acetoin utilization protein AcuC [Staphylococcus sp. HMSC062A01]